MRAPGAETTRLCVCRRSLAAGSRAITRFGAPAVWRGISLRRCGAAERIGVTGGLKLGGACPSVARPYGNVEEICRVEINGAWGGAEGGWFGTGKAGRCTQRGCRGKASGQRTVKAGIVWAGGRCEWGDGGGGGNRGGGGGGVEAAAHAGGQPSACSTAQQPRRSNHITDKRTAPWRGTQESSGGSCSQHTGGGYTLCASPAPIRRRTTTSP
eukprot:scaffold16556_cov133-Isochrysis_galbana.AAC.2